jgi:hypothetical protein
VTLLAWAGVAGFAALCTLTVVLLVALRLLRDRHRSREQRSRSQLRSALLAMPLASAAAG